MPIAAYGTPSTEEIPDAVSKYLPYYDAVLLENHGALTYSDNLLNAYHKMESVVFYAQLLYQSKVLGGPKELSLTQVQTLYALRKSFGLSGRHPANLPQNSKEEEDDFSDCGQGKASAGHGVDAELVASITRKVMEQLGL